MSSRLRILKPGEFINLGSPTLTETGSSSVVQVLADGSRAATLLLARQQANASTDTLSNEEQTLTVGGAGLTSFTVTFDGDTTAAIAAGATAAVVQAALEAIASIGVGNIVVTGDPGGPWTLEFVGDLAETNVAQVTTTPTGGTGTVTPATTVAGGAAGQLDYTTTIEGSFDQVSWWTLATFTAVEDTGSFPAVENEVFGAAVVAPYIRATFTVTGTGTADVDLFVAAA